MGPAIGTASLALLASQVRGRRERAHAHQTVPQAARQRAREGWTKCRARGRRALLS